MMDAIRQYILQLTAAAAVGAVACGMVGKKGTVGAAVKFLTGVFLIVTAASPLTGLRPEQLRLPGEQLQAQAAAAAARGQAEARRCLEQSIISRTEAYILDKAASISVQVTAEVTLSPGELPVPRSVILRGAAGPYDRTRLERWISRELGIEKEQIQWR